MCAEKGKFARLADQYRTALFEDVIPFWEKHSIDEKQGGYFTCLERDGSVFDTDKFMWLQCRQIWQFAMLYNQVEQRSDWLDIAKNGIEFLKKHGRDADGNWYFSLRRDGTPLVQPCNIFSDCFAAIAFGEYAQASGDDESMSIAMATYQNILGRMDDPKGQYNKLYPGTRPLRAMSIPMILLNITLQLEPVLDADRVGQVTTDAMNDMFSVFLDPDRMLLHENVAPDGSADDSFEGRLLIPGHGIECMWFVMDCAERRNDSGAIAQACEVVLSTLRHSWDEEHGGIFYFMDAEGRPPQQLEWDQKLWWVHLETLIALAMGYRLTGEDELWQWYEKVHDYTWSHFPDPEQGEWYGYLDRRGDVLLPLKGGKWKGCFHVPRGLYRCMREFELLGA